MTPFGINYGTKLELQNYAGNSAVPAQPVWETDSKVLYIVDGTSGKYRIAMSSELLDLRNFFSQQYSGLTLQVSSVELANEALNTSVSSLQRTIETQYVKSSDLEKWLNEIANEGAALAV